MAEGELELGLPTDDHGWPDWPATVAGRYWIERAREALRGEQVDGLQTVPKHPEFDRQVAVNLSLTEIEALLHAVGETADGDLVTAAMKLGAAVESGRRLRRW